MHLPENQYIVAKPVIDKNYNRLFCGSIFKRQYSDTHYLVRASKSMSAIFDHMIKEDSTGTLCKKAA